MTIIDEESAFDYIKINIDDINWEHDDDAMSRKMNDKGKITLARVIEIPREISYRRSNSGMDINSKNIDTRSTETGEYR